MGFEWVIKKNWKIKNGELCCFIFYMKFKTIKNNVFSINTGNTLKTFG